MRIVRAFWGDIHKYYNQINKATDHNLNEVVYVWGKRNHDFIHSLGFETRLVSDESYDSTISSNHTFLDHRNLIHKLKCLDLAIKELGEIIFLDWDCYPTIKIDKFFYESISSGAELRVPLYIYPKFALDYMIEQCEGTPLSSFFHKLKKFVYLYSYEFGENFVIPNTGFVYCRNKAITEKLLALADQHTLETVPDELAVMCYVKELNYSLDDYIEKIEPNVIGGKEHSERWWIEEQKKFDSYIEKKILKRIYFQHI